MSGFNSFARCTALAGSAGALALSLVAPANAQDAADAPVLEEILVTAQKRTEDVQDVPSSISVLNIDVLKQLHATTLTDYAAYVPGLNVNSGGSPGQTTVTLRGIAPVGPGSVVGFYGDDIPLGSSGNYARAVAFGLDLMPYDVERIEVLRGPQGTLYGAGAMGGLLKYVLKDPDLTELQLQAGLETLNIADADDLGWGARVAVNAPLVTDRLALWASYFNQDTPGYIDNAFTGGTEDENGVKQDGGRAVLLWQLRDGLSLKLGGMWQRVESDNNATTVLELTGLDPPTGTESLGELTSFHPLDQPFEKDIEQYSATLDWDLGWATVTSASGLSQTTTDQVQDASFIFGTLYPLLTGGAIPAGLSEFRLGLDLDKKTQELRLASPSGGKLEWLIGAYYTDEESTNVQDVFAFDNDGQLIPAFAPFFAFVRLPSNYEEIAGFGSLTYRFTDRFDLTGGLRWASNEQDFRQISGGAILLPADDPGRSSEDVLTWMVSPRFHLSDDTMLYARVATGYRPGGPNTLVPGFEDVPPQVDADTLINYEAGIKSRFLDYRALVNFSVFYIDWTDIQLARSFGGVSALDNAGDAKSQGFELESTFSPFDGLRLGINAAYTDATLEASPPDLGNQIGARLPGVPEWSGSLTADYHFTLAEQWFARIGGGFRYVGEQETEVVTVVDNLSYVLPSYSVLDLNADVTHGNWTFRLFARNVADKRAYTGGNVTVDGLNVPVHINANVLQPRTFGASVDVTF